MSDEDLEDVGIENAEHRLKFLNKILKLNRLLVSAPKLSFLHLQTLLFPCRCRTMTEYVQQLDPIKVHLIWIGITLYTIIFVLTFSVGIFQF